MDSVASPSLANCLMKLRQARRHLEELRHATRDFLDPDSPPGPPCRLREEPTADWKVAWLAVDRDPPPEWAHAAAAAMRTLRVALDMLIPQLWLLNGETPPKKGVGFPILLYRPTKDDRKKLGNAIKGISSGYRNLIREMQPYRNKGTRDAWVLTTLAGFDNIDAHADLHPMYVVRKHRFWGLEVEIVLQDPETGEELHAGAFQIAEGELEHGDEVARVKPATASVVPQVEISIAFGDPALRLGDLIEIYNRIVRFIRAFDEVFPVPVFPPLRPQ